MAFSSFTWPFRRRSSGGGGAGPSKPAGAEGKEEEELGVTPQLLDFLRTLSSDAFKSAALQLNQGTPPTLSILLPPLVLPRLLTMLFYAVSGGSAEAAAGELSDWQQRHAVLVLGRAKVGFPADLVSRGHFFSPERRV
jgi:hypothetical protein